MESNGYIKLFTGSFFHCCQTTKMGLAEAEQNCWKSRSPWTWCLTETRRAWTSNYIHCFMWDIHVIINQFPNFSGSLTKPPLKLRHRWVLHPTTLCDCNYFSMLVSWKNVPGVQASICCRNWLVTLRFVLIKERIKSVTESDRTVSFVPSYVGLTCSFKALPVALLVQHDPPPKKKCIAMYFVIFFV